MNTFPVPEVLECMHFVLSSSRENKRIIRNYEFDFYLKGEREVYVDGVQHHISRGSLVFRKPGQLTTGVGDYNMYMITLDFSHTVDRARGVFRSSDAPEQPRCELDILENIPTVFTPFHQSELLDLYEKLIQSSYPNVVDEERQRAYVSELLFLIFADAYAYRRQGEDEGNAKKSYVRRACNLINKHYSEPLSVDDIAAGLSINKNYFIKLFKKEMNTTPNRYVNEVRLFRAAGMLLQTDHPVHFIAASCGFNNTSYFIKSFKERFGKTPLEYKMADSFDN